MPSAAQKIAQRRAQAQAPKTGYAASYGRRQATAIEAADREKRASRGAVGASSSLTGTGREIQKRQNADRHQVNRQKRVQRLLDRAGRKGDIDAAVAAEEFGARMRKEGGPVSNVTSANQGYTTAERSLEDEATLAALLREETEADHQRRREAAQSPGAPDGEYVPPQMDLGQSPGAQTIPPADATTDSATNNGTAAALRNVPESDVADSNPTATPLSPSRQKELDYANSDYAFDKPSNRPSIEVAAGDLGIDIESEDPALAYTSPAAIPDIDEGMRRARENSNIVAISDGVPYFKMSNGEVVEFPGGMEELNARASQQAAMYENDLLVEKMGKNKRLNEGIAASNEFQASLDPNDPFGERAAAMGATRDLNSGAQADPVALNLDQYTDTGDSGFETPAVGDMSQLTAPDTPFAPTRLAEVDRHMALSPGARAGEKFRSRAEERVRSTMDAAEQSLVATGSAMGSAISRAQDIGAKLEVAGRNAAAYSRDFGLTAGWLETIPGTTTTAPSGYSALARWLQQEIPEVHAEANAAWLNDYRAAQPSRPGDPPRAAAVKPPPPPPVKDAEARLFEEFKKFRQARGQNLQ